VAESTAVLSWVQSKYPDLKQGRPFFGMAMRCKIRRLCAAFSVLGVDVITRNGLFFISIDLGDNRLGCSAKCALQQ
jgi:hypothetical protein